MPAHEVIVFPNDTLDRSAILARFTLTHGQILTSATGTATATNSVANARPLCWDMLGDVLVVLDDCCILSRYVLVWPEATGGKGGDGKKRGSVSSVSSGFAALFGGLFGPTDAEKDAVLVRDGYMYACVCVCMHD
jgi:hypothetical protein